MLCSFKFHWLKISGFFDCERPCLMAVWRYVLLFRVIGSDIAHVLKNDWSYVRCGIDEILSDKGVGRVLTTKIQHQVIRVIAITDV
ncbi:hypothetical protein EKN44_15135 [Enterobacter hormaechei]|nr:hypothetical protein EYC86_02990 [Enterobacter hormaechei]HAS1810053.1 hypothetical protein [Enterobacter hormaechei subsp. xiangfangensis]RLZ74307.1 hypothetical protein EA146_11345 [Enterobacter hormaechei]RSA05951.1 hypothetical protein EGK19_14695 [Enterobacter hormaechei]RSA16830.1 hypothetical protein EGK25_15200 [Enterobacter hormaechei]